MSISNLRKTSAYIIAIFMISCTASKSSVQKQKTPAAPPVPQKPTVSNETDSLSYAIGVQVATYYKNQGMDSINLDALKKAYQDVYNDSPLVMNLEQCNMTLQSKLQEFMHRKLEKSKSESKAFLDSTAKLPGVTVLPSGLQYRIITRGNGPIPKATDTVKAHYSGTLINGLEFDNSYKRGEPLEIPVGGVIKGWTEALELMPVGSKWELFIPSNLAYGDRGAGGAIPGGAALIFTVELLGIVHH